MSILSFREKVMKEAEKQRELIKQGQKVPATAKKYARMAGLVISIVTILALAAFWGIYAYTGDIYVGAILFAAVFLVLGLFQLITGRNISSLK